MFTHSNLCAFIFDTIIRLEKQNHFDIFQKHLINMDECNVDDFPWGGAEAD